MTEDDQLADKLAKDYATARISQAEVAMLDYAAKLTREPWTIVEADIQALRQSGFSDRAILDINQVTGYYAYVNRLADGLGVTLEPYWEEDQ